MFYIDSLASISFPSSPYHEALSSVTSSSSFEFKLLLNSPKYALLGSDGSFPMIVSNYLELD